jgi:hypothetical protein
MDDFELTRGHRPDEDWAEGPDGNWTAGFQDRRRLFFADINRVAEAQGGGVFGPQVLMLLPAYAVGDAPELVQAFKRVAGLA